MTLWILRTRHSLLFAAALLLAAGCGKHNAAPTPAPSPTAASVAVSCDTTALAAIGQQGRCQARVTLSDASTQDQTSAAQWSSSDPSKVAVTASGVISALAPVSSSLEEIFLKAMGHLAHTPGEGAALDVGPM